MALSRSARITLLLIIDVIFFLVELIVGYAVGSLALVADSFHMLNDVMSLIVALYAIKLTAHTKSDSRYSYGWHRAEILAALINGVFLLALCFSISLEAVGRFFTSPEITNPKLVVVVGSLGLASNIVGLFLFREHGHSHEHSSSPSQAPSITGSAMNGTGDVTPKQKPIPINRTRSSSVSGSFSSLYGHPAATRASLVQTANEIAYARSPSPPPHRKAAAYTHPSGEAEGNIHDIPTEGHDHSATGSPSENTPLLAAQHLHEHNKNSTEQHHHHSHGSMNMRALVLHVIGDALGNVGVIATGLIIWLSSWSYKYYFDPVISLVITIIIFSSALPLVRSASFILLQGVPSTISLEQVRSAILAVDGVLSLHELHIWQLSESKVVASVHVLASPKHDFMPIASKIRSVLHYHGIHSSTIQPEYFPPANGSTGTTLSDNSCLILCPVDQECDPVQNACCRELLH
ncbi:cation efflux protein [Pluteus cervinus]|uniref:Cation efflux protein n=1 Tax=Pluteus cervinus TaxID=181527 RepID=A0ACD3BG75_9AGAR|nr:cation efflux protein [Pluteus cervinus]